MPTTPLRSNSSLIIGIVVLLLLLGSGWWYFMKSSSILPLASGDSIASWDFQGARNDNGPLEEGAQKEIVRLEALLGGDQGGVNDDPTDYTLYVAIAQQYEQLGDGASARTYLEKALAIDSENTGLAWHNLGSLYARLGAFTTAGIAYEKATKAQSNVIQYHLSYLRFLMEHFASDVARVDAAFTDAHAAVGGDPAILQIEAEWYEATNRNDRAIEVLEGMKTAMPSGASAIDAEIARLRAQ